MTCSYKVVVASSEGGCCADVDEATAPLHVDLVMYIPIACSESFDAEIGSKFGMMAKVSPKSGEMFWS